MVNEKIFTCLSDKLHPKKYLSATKNDTTYIFDGISIEWNGIQISNCQVVHSPVTNRNIIGVKLADRFNFVLAYNEKKNNRTEDNLYLQLRENKSGE